MGYNKALRWNNFNCC